MSNFPWESKALVLKVWFTETLSVNPRDQNCFCNKTTLFAIFTVTLSEVYSGVLLEAT